MIGLQKLQKMESQTSPVTWTVFKTLLQKLDMNVTGELDKIQDMACKWMKKKKKKMLQ